MPKSKAQKALCFVDARGGAFAIMAAAIARARGQGNTVAATTSAAADVPSEIALVLGEIGLAPEGEVVLAGALPRDAERVDLSSWGLTLHEGEGELERKALARIARDRIEKRLAP
jgi:hypothetical protein